MNKEGLRKAFDKIMESIPEGKIEFTLDQKVDFMILYAKHKISQRIELQHKLWLWKHTGVVPIDFMNFYYPFCTTDGIIPTLEQIYSPKIYFMP